MKKNNFIKIKILLVQIKLHLENQFYFIRKLLFFNELHNKNKSINTKVNEERKNCGRRGRLLLLFSYCRRTVKDYMYYWVRIGYFTSPNSVWICLGFGLEVRQESVKNLELNCCALSAGSHTGDTVRFHCLVRDRKKQ